MIPELPCRKALYGTALIIGLLTGATCPETALAQEENRMADRVEARHPEVVANVFGFCFGQHYAPEQVGELHPDLAAEAARAEISFDIATSKVCDKAKDYLVQQYSSTGVDDLERQYLEEVKRLMDFPDRSIAEAFLAEVQGRAHWQIAQPFLSNILAVR